MPDFPFTDVSIEDRFPKTNASSKYVSKLGNGHYSGGEKSASTWTHEVVTITINFPDSKTQTIIDFINDNQQSLNRFITPGYTPFYRTSTTNYAYILGSSNFKKKGDFRNTMNLTLKYEPAP